MTDRSRERFDAGAGTSGKTSGWWTGVEIPAMGYGSDRSERSMRGPHQQEISPDARRDEIAAEACNAIFWNLAVPRDRVSVQCDHGWVTLTGTVERPYQRSAAEAGVRRVAGVQGVTNAIIVKERNAAD